MSTVDINELIGDRKAVDRELREFRKTAMRLSSRQERMIERYPGKWVALHSGRVRAHGESFDAVLERIDDLGLSRDQTIVRYIDEEPRTMIL